MLDFNEVVGWATILTLIVTVLVSVIHLINAVRERRSDKKQLLCVTNPITSPILFASDKLLTESIECSYLGEPIKNLRIMQFVLENESNLEIEASQIFEPIRFEFAPGAKVLREPEVIEIYHEELKMTWHCEKKANEELEIDTVRLDSKLLFKPNEYIKAQLVWVGPKNEPQLKGRIKGINIKQIRQADLSMQNFKASVLRNVIIWGILLIISTILLAWTAERGAPFNISRSGYLYIGIVLGFIYCTFLGSLLNGIQNQRKKVGAHRR